MRAMDVLHPTPAWGREPSWKDFFRGFALPWSAFRLVFASTQLLLLTCIACAVTLVVLVALAWGLVHSTGDGLALLLPRPSAAWALMLWDALAVLVGGVLFVVGANTLPLLMLAVLQDPLSRTTEGLCGAPAPPPFSLQRAWRATTVALGHTALRVTLLVGGQLGLLLLNLLPGVGHVLWAVSSALWTMLWLAVEYVDSPMTRRGHSWATVRGMISRRLALSLGLGAALYLLLWIPVLDFFLVPVAVIAGTLFVRGLDAAGALPATPTSH